MNQTESKKKLLSELLGDSEPQGELRGSAVPSPAKPVNKQLYENSDVASLCAHMRELGQMSGEDFFNAKEPNLAIMSEKPEHRTMIFLKARGHSLSEIAKATGFTVPWVSQVLRQPWARARIAEELNLAGRDELSTLIESAAKDSMETLITLRDNDDAPASVRANVSQYLVDRFLGKPKQSVEQKIGSLDELSDEQLTAIASGAITPATTRN